MELLVAMAIFGVVVAVVYATMRVGVDTWRSAEAGADLQREMRVAFRFFSRDIRDIYTSAYGVKTSFVGAADHLAFYRRGGPAGLEQVAYGLDAASGDLIRGQRENIRNEEDLAVQGRLNIPAAGPAAGEGQGVGGEPSFKVQPLVERVTRVRFRYYDGKRRYWLDEWDSAGDEGRLPATVEMTLWVVAGRKSFQELMGRAGNPGMAAGNQPVGLRLPPFIAPVYFARQWPGDEGGSWQE